MNMAKQFINDVVSILPIAENKDKVEINDIWMGVKIDDYAFHFLNHTTSGKIHSSMFKCFFSKDIGNNYKTSEIYFNTKEGYEVCFSQKSGLIINENVPEELSNNVFEWTEEDFFYFKLKYGE